MKTTTIAVLCMLLGAVPAWASGSRELISRETLQGAKCEPAPKTIFNLFKKAKVCAQKPAPVATPPKAPATN